MAKLDVVQLLLIGGGIAIIGYGAWLVYVGGGGTGPRVTARTNPIRSSEAAGTAMVFDVRGFPPLEDIVGYFRRDNGIRIGLDHIRTPVDANGNLVYTPCTVGDVRIAAALNGGGYVTYQINNMGQSGLIATVKIIIDPLVTSYNGSSL